MTTLQDLKTEYVNRQNETETLRLAEEQAMEAKRQQILNDLLPRVLVYLSNRENVAVDELNQYGSIEANWSEFDDTALGHICFTLSVPEHQPVSFVFYQDNEKKIRPNNKWWSVQNGRGYPETLGEALVLAADVYEKNQKYIAEQKVENEEYQIEKVLKEHKTKQEQSELQHTLEQIAADPTAVLLLKLFAAIQQERTCLAEQITRLEESVDTAMHHYDAELSEAREKAHRYERKTQELQTDTQSLRYQVDDLESDLKKAKRTSR